MATQKTETKLIIELATANENEYETVTINYPLNSISEITKEKTAAVLAAAKVTVEGGGTLIQTKSGFDVDHIKQSYIAYTSKTWVDESN